MQKEIRELADKITTAQEAYYNSQPVMSDGEYDALSDQLRKLDPENKVLRIVGAEPLASSPLQKVKHLIPMGSQRKVVSRDEFETWVVGTTAHRFILQEKMDGLSIELIYKGGSLARAITRGNGFIGEDVTHNVVLVQGTPQKLHIPWSGSLRGEIQLPIKSFETRFRSLDYVTARNAASGILRTKEENKDAQYLIISFFDIASTDRAFVTERDKMQFMEEKLRISVARYAFVGLENAIKCYKLYVDKKRAKLPYEIDGLVVKVNDLKLQESLGIVHNRPKGQIAWKFPSTEANTTLRDITGEIGLTGRITPVAHVTPVECGGVTVSKMSLHTWGNIVKLGLSIGATVVISRRNDVIPYLERVVGDKSFDNKLFERLASCPTCKTATQFEGEFLVCPNPDCPEKVKGDLKKWVKVLEIDLVGDTFIDTFAGTLLIAPVDLYKITVDDIAHVAGYGQVSAQKIYDNIHRKKVLPLAQFLAALNIPNVSVQTFRLIERAGFDTLEKVLNATVLDLAKVHNIGDITAGDAVAGLRIKRPLIAELTPKYITIAKSTNTKLAGQSFCFTGEISIRRGDAQRIVAELGGEVRNSVGKGLTYLVQANPKSKTIKSQKAKAMDVKVIGEDEFMEIIDFSFSMLRKT